MGKHCHVHVRNTALESPRMGLKVSEGAPRFQPPSRLLPQSYRVDYIGAIDSGISPEEPTRRNEKRFWRVAFFSSQRWVGVVAPGVVCSRPSCKQTRAGTEPSPREGSLFGKTSEVVGDLTSQRREGILSA